MGTIGYYNEAEGFGKIETDFGEEVLVYQKGALNGINLKAGLKVSFDMHQALSIAVNVQVID
ncbi:hypothetical protein ACS5PU_20975 [Pedobacter sp. GSP4]|uniref:hypothetical protein n=1 Tax=Pedobacter sp. GSP4 TaxID=3453716 RepID=UPI003EEB1088